MMKKSILPIILLSCLLLLAGCNKGQTNAANDGASIIKGKSAQASSVNDGQNQNMTYKVTRQTYTEKNIKAIYPQITGLSDKNTEDRINEMLKKKALGLCNFSQIDEVHAACDYEIKWQSANLLSIVYTGECQ